MTEGSLKHYDKSMCVRIWLEVGHACEPPRRSSLYGNALAIDWRVWVRGVSGRDISAFVNKVVFYLHPASAFVYPKRVLREPPYEITESGCTSIEIPIHVYLKYCEEPTRIRLKYSLEIENTNRSSSESRCIFYDLENPSEQLLESLMEGGGEMIARTGSLPHKGDKLVLLSSDDEKKKKRNSSTKNYKFVKPLKFKTALKGSKKTNSVVEQKANCSNVDFNTLLASTDMPDDEIQFVSHLHSSLNHYERSAPDRLELPPITDPIYQMPEVPPYLRKALAEAEEESKKYI